MVLITCGKEIAEGFSSSTLESAVNQIATRITVQALFCNIKFNERLLLHSIGNGLARSLTNYPLSFQIRQLGNGFFLLQHDYGTIGSTA